MINKDELRKYMLIMRKGISDKEKISTIIVDKIINLDIYKKSKVIALYKSMLDEVNTSKLIKESLKSKVVLLPRVIGDKMIFVEINSKTSYKKSHIGVLEPIGNEYSGTIDLIIVPGLSFDKLGNRLGYGKGFYDRFLRDKSIYKIGICFNKQIYLGLPCDNYDIPMNLVITEKEFLK